MTDTMASAFRQEDLFDAPQELPQGLRYEPSFVSAVEETSLVREIAALPLREARFREYFARRRVLHFHDEEAAPADDDGGADTVASGRLPPWLDALRNRVAAHLDLGAATIVHALVSEYSPGTPIGWHRDRPVYGIVAGVSLAGTGRMRFRPYAAQDAAHTLTLDLAPRSLYVMRDDIRWRWQHSLLPVRSLRYSITFRTAATGAQQAHA